jgi:hypothetical protein
MINEARKTWLDTLTLADRLAYDRAAGEYYFTKGPWIAAAHQFAKDQHYRRHRRKLECPCSDAPITETSPILSPGHVPTPAAQ